MTTQDKFPSFKRNEDQIWAEIVLCSIGVFMFVITVAILSKKTLHSTYTKILINTAILDNIYLIGILISNILFVLFDKKIFHVQPLMSMIPFVPITLMVVTAEAYMVAALVIQHVRVILEPVKHERWLNERKTCWMILCVWIFSIGYNYPHWQAYMPAMIHFNKYNYTWPNLWRDDTERFISSHFYTRIYGLFLLCGFEFLVPITVFIAGLVIVRYSQHSQHAQHSQHSQHAQHFHSRHSHSQHSQHSQNSQNSQDLENVDLDLDSENVVRSPARKQWLEMNKSLCKPIRYIVMTSLLTRILTACFFTFQGPSYCPEVHACMFSDRIIRIVYVLNALLKFFIYIIFMPSFRKVIIDFFLCCKSSPQPEFV